MSESRLPAIMPGAEPYFQQGGEAGCLLLHGFAASPAELRWLGEHLAAAGHTVYIPRLPGHGSDYRDMARVRWRDWYLAALDGLHLLRGHCRQVVTVGHSMGGLLGLLLGAAGLPDALVVIAGPMYAEARMMPYTRWLKHVLRYSDQTDKSPLAAIIRAEQERRGETVRGRVRYDLWSTSAVAELYALMRRTWMHLPEVQAPLLLVYSATDPTVALRSRDAIAQGVSSKVIEQKTLERGGHIIPQDVAREEAFAAIAGFIRRQT